MRISACIASIASSCLVFVAIRKTAIGVIAIRALAIVTVVAGIATIIAVRGRAQPCAAAS